MAGWLTVLSLVVTAVVEAPGRGPLRRGTAHDVVRPVARTVESRVAPVRAPAPAAARELPRWCRAADACVDRRARVAWLTAHGGILRGPVPVSLGGPGHRTPSGRFHVAWKAERWTSTEYDLSMPFSVFFATGGIAFHAGPLDEPSHGCVHLRRHDASRFFARLQVGDVVVVR